MQTVTRPSHSVTTVVLVLAMLLAVLPAAIAQAQQVPSDVRERTVRLVERPDGTLEVQRGPSFAATTGRLVAKEQDVVLSTAGSFADYMDESTGLVTDEFRLQQWNLDVVAAESVWQRATGTGQVIAVIDSGVDGAHPDLDDRLVRGFSAVGGNPATDPHGHGTHVAGTAAASVDGEYGVAGIAPESSIMPIQVTDADGLAYSSDVAEGLIWAVSNGATVANMSLAGTQESSVLSAAIDYAVANGVVVVVAGGNEFQRDNPQMWPAAHPDVIAVAALSDEATRSTFSSTGDWIDLAAPGSSILSTRPAATFGRASGTSMAAPLVAGAVAVLRSAGPDLGVDEVRDLLLAHAADLGTTGWDAEYGHGRVDLFAALQTVTEAPVEDTPEEEVPDVPEVAEPTGPPPASPVPYGVQHYQRG